MKVYFLVILIIILFIWLNKKDKEHFVNNDAIYETLKSNWDGILETVEPSTKKFNNSSQIAISNIIKLNRINEYKYNYKNNIINNKIIYDYSLDEHINSINTSIIIGNSFDTNKNSNSYGFITTFNPDEELHNFACIGIGLNKNLDLNKINDLKKEIKVPDRKILEIFSVDNAPNEFSKYFNYEKKIKFIGIFENQNNLDFINNLPIPKKFNLVDFYGNRILTRCTLDYPYCNIELPVEKNVRGRNEYVVAKYDPYKLGVTLLTENGELKKYDTLKNCNLERNDNKELIIDDNNTKLLSLDDNILANDKEFIEKNFINMTNFKCRNHSSDFIDKFYYGGIDTKDNKIKCYSEKGSECLLYDNLNSCKNSEHKLETYKLSEKGKDCEDGFTRINNHEECKKAAKYIYGNSERSHYCNEKEPYFCDLESSSLRNGREPNKYKFMVKECSTDNREEHNIGFIGGTRSNIQGFHSYICKNTNTNIEINPNTGLYPFTINEQDKVKYEKYSKIGCLKTQEKEVFCKHIHNNILSDLITFNLDECVEKNAEDILKNRSIMDLRSIPGLKEYTREEKIEYYKNKLFMEPYLEETKNNNKTNLLNNIPYFMRLKNNYEDGKVTTICEIVKNNKEGYQSLTYMESNINGEIIKLTNSNKIYIRIDKNKKLIFSILDQNDNLLSDYMVDDTIEVDFGEKMNFYISTNNKNIFENPFYTENLNGVIIPYLSKIDINFLD